MIGLMVLLAVSIQPGNVQVLEKGTEDVFLPKGGAFLDTVYFEDFEGESLEWTFHDFTAQDAEVFFPKDGHYIAFEGHDTVYWHVDTMKVFQGDSCLWCGRYAPDWWNNPYGYSNGWVQHAMTPYIDLTSIPAGDTVLLVYWQYYNIEPPGTWGPFNGWDCINLWISTDSGNTWEILYPDTLRWPGTGYVFTKSYAWFYNAPWDECWKNCGIDVPGWGGTNGDWKEYGFDLTPYIGNVVMIRFSFLSDPAESDADGGPYGGWWIDTLRIVDISSTGTTVLFYEDFEDGDDGWTYQCKVPKGNYWHLTENDCSSPTHSLVCSDSTETYIPCGLLNLAGSPVIDLSGLLTTRPCSLYFDAKYDFWDINEGDCGDFDCYSIWVSEDDGKTWIFTTGYVYVGSTPGWVRVGFEIPSEFIGKKIRIGIMVMPDPDELLAGPMYIDNVTVLGKYPRGFPPPEEILLVDDDADAYDVNGVDWDKYWDAALAASGYRYNVIHTSIQGIPDSLYLMRHGAVIWTVGSDYPNRLYSGYAPLDTAEIEAILGYLRHGGKLWLAGQNIFDPANPLLDSLFLAYLHVDSYVKDARCDTVVGDGAPFVYGLKARLYFSPLNGNNFGWDNTDLIYPDSEACAVFWKRGTDPIGIAYRGDYTLVVTSFLLEAMTSLDTLVSDQALRDTVVSRVLGFINPGMPAPRNVAVNDSAIGMVVSWDPNFPRNLVAYRVYRGRSKLGPYTFIGEVPAGYNTFIDTDVPPDTLYFWTVTAVGFSGEESYYAEPVAGVHRFGVPSGVVEKDAVKVFPNPFHGTVNLIVPGEGKEAKIEIYNVMGRKVKTLFRGMLDKGIHKFVWNGETDNGERAASGVYFLRIEGASTHVYKLVMVK